MYLPGQLVWGKRKGHGWWPGGIISAAESFRGRPPYDGHQWIKWFAEKKTSQVSGIGEYVSPIILVPESCGSLIEIMAGAVSQSVSQGSRPLDSAFLV